MTFQMALITIITKICHQNNCNISDTAQYTYFYLLCIAQNYYYMHICIESIFFCKIRKEILVLFSVNNIIKNSNEIIITIVKKILIR